MANPVPYVRAYGFTNYQATHPSDPLPGNQVDAELDAIASAFAATDTALSAVRRSDGALANAIVTPDSLAASTLTLLSALGINPRGGWLTATQYAIRDIVTQSSTTYICVAAHLSGTFATDLAAGDWMVLSNPVANQSLNTSSSVTFSSVSAGASGLSSLALNGATIGTNKLAVTGTSAFAGAVSCSAGGFTDTSGNGFTVAALGATTGYSSLGIQTSTATWFVINQSNGVALTLNAAAWSAYSDETMKTAFAPFTSALDKVSRIKAGVGRYLTDPDGTSRSFLSAQSVQAVLPEAVTVREADPEHPSEWDGKLLLAYTEVIPLLVAALAETKARIEALEAK